MPDDELSHTLHPPADDGISVDPELRDDVLAVERLRLRLEAARLDRALNEEQLAAARAELERAVLRRRAEEAGLVPRPALPAQPGTAPAEVPAIARPAEIHADHPLAPSSLLVERADRGREDRAERPAERAPAAGVGCMAVVGLVMAVAGVLGYREQKQQAAAEAEAVRQQVRRDQERQESERKAALSKARVEAAKAEEQRQVTEGYWRRGSRMETVRRVQGEPLRVHATADAVVWYYADFTFVAFHQMHLAGDEAAEEILQWAKDGVPPWVVEDWNDSRGLLKAR